MGLKNVVRYGMAMAAAAVAAMPAAGQVRDIRLERFDTRIEVRRDASIDVTETLRIRFDGSWNGIERDLFLDHETGEGRRQRLRMDLRSVTDAAGAPLRVEEEGIAQGRRLRIWVPGAENASRAVVIRYHVPKVIRFFDASHPTGLHDELYWDVTGNEWEMPIDRATATVSLPGGVENVQAWAYTGATYSQQQDATVEVVGNEVRVETNARLAPREGLTVSVTFAPGVVERPGAASRLWASVVRWWPLGVPFFAFFTMFGRWKREGRDPAERAISVQYEPPSELTAAEIGTLVDHRAEMHDITSMLVDLAVRGYLVIEEREEKKLLGLFSDTEYWFHQRRGEADWGELAPFERRFLSALFGSASSVGGLAVLGRLAREFGGSELARAFEPPADAAKLPSVRLKDLENRFYKHLDGIRGQIYTSLIQKGMYAKRPDSVRNTYLVAAAVAVGFGFAASAFIANRPWLGDPFAIWVGFGLAAVITAGFALVMPTRTERGARAREKGLGFKEFLGRVEQDRFKRMIKSPDQFERYLPYAMAFRVEERWAKAFEELYRTPPDWYHGRPGGTFRTTHLARSMNSMSSQAGRTLASSPKSSSSGSGGGGFSGGGSGGGGGRGF